MSIYAILGDIQFHILAVEGLKSSHGYKFEEQGLVNGKPQLQATGNELAAVDLTLKFTSSFCDPQEEFLKIKAAAEKKEPLAFVLGTEGIYKGYYVITNIDNDLKKTDANGNPIYIELSLKLKEFVKSAAKETIKKTKTKQPVTTSDNIRRVQYVR